MHNRRRKRIQSPWILAIRFWLASHALGISFFSQKFIEHVTTCNFTRCMSKCCNVAKNLISYAKNSKTTWCLFFLVFYWFHFDLCHISWKHKGSYSEVWSFLFVWKPGMWVSVTNEGEITREYWIFWTRVYSSFPSKPSCSNYPTHCNS